MQSYNNISNASIINSNYAPPGIVHPLFMDKWASNDDSLHDLYYGDEYIELNDAIFNEETFNEEQEQEQDTNFLKENWAWVDERLRELYYGYGLNDETFNEEQEQDTNFLKENWAWVDKRLRELYYGYGLNDATFNDEQEQDDNLLNDNYDWVDEKMSEQYDDLFTSASIVLEDEYLTQCPSIWMNYEFDINFKPLEDLSYMYTIRREPYYYEPVEDIDEEPIEFTLLECIAATESNVELESDMDVESDELEGLLDGYDSDELYNKYIKVKID